VAFIGTSGIFVIHTTIFPFPIAADVVSALGDGSTDFREALHQRHVDDKFFRWSRSSSTRSNHDIDRQAKLLWMVWPVFLVLAVASVVACVALIRYAYFRTLSEFHATITKRATEYLNLDTRRLQE
ncbi:MAG: hypothetical protein ABI557_22030, partial [Aureliella sp.]